MRVSPTSVIAAYQRALEASIKVNASIEMKTQRLKPVSVLRVGDDLTVTQAAAMQGVRSAEGVKASSFDNVLQSELIKTQVRQIKSADKTMFKLSHTDGGGLSANPIEIIQQMDSAQAAVLQLASIRDKLLEAYKTIFSMAI